MKKIFATALAALLMTATITGCGPTKEENGNTTGTNNAETGEEHKEIEIVPTQEILEADISSCKVQIGNDLIVELPITLEKLMSMGATVPDDVDPENDIVDSGLHGSKNVTLNISGNLYSFIFYNNTDKNIKLKDCVCIGVWDKIERNNYTAQCVLPGGIRVGSTREEVKDVYGELCEESSTGITAEIKNAVSNKYVLFYATFDSSTKAIIDFGCQVHYNE